MGAMFSLLALKYVLLDVYIRCHPIPDSFRSVENKTITFPSLPSAKATGSKKSVVGSIVGGVIGGLTLIGIVVVGVFLWKRRGKHFPAPAATDMREDRFEEQTMIPYDYNPHEQSREPETVSLQQAQLQSQPALVRPIPLVQGVMIPSNKAREAASNARSQTPSNRVSSGPSGSNPIPNRESPRATSSSNTTRISTTAVQGLRADVENLRRAMEEIQAERMEAPPGYHDI